MSEKMPDFSLHFDHVVRLLQDKAILGKLPLDILLELLDYWYWCYETTGSVYSSETGEVSDKLVLSNEVPLDLWSCICHKHLNLIPLERVFETVYGNWDCLPVRPEPWRNRHISFRRKIVVYVEDRIREASFLVGQMKDRDRDLFE